MKPSTFHLIILTTVLIVVALQIKNVLSHGFLFDPPGRSSMWRYGYPTPINYDDNGLWCGGAMAFMENNYTCGVCGDNYADPTPREHELGGKYGLGLVSRRFSKGGIVDIEVFLTANHFGHFDFKICPASESTKEVTQECLDQNVLKVLDDEGNEHDRYVVTNGERNVSFFTKLRLPSEMTCTHCVLQWTYVASNTWGTCDNGTEGIGCGAQETFKNCADIAIMENTSGRPPTQVPPKNRVLVRDSTGNLVPLVVRSQVCKGYGTYSTQPGIDLWCQENCMRYPPNCPEDKCKCIEYCEPHGEFRNVSGAQFYCDYHCFTYPAKNCNEERCKCY